MNRQKTQFIAKASVIEDIAQSQLERIKAVATELKERGEFPTNIVSQPDVLALRSIFLTTGRPGNLNDDVILNEEILPVLFTGANKPFNIEHTSQIVGVMFDAFAIDREDGKVVPGLERFDGEFGSEEHEAERQRLMEAIAEMPENLDIVTNSVIWRLHFPAEAQKIKNKAISGDMFVSMEIWFTDFDYLLGNRVIKRTPELSGLLDRKLRINGGDGFVGLERLRRIPRQLTIAGVAAVETPANPDSFILDVMDRADMADKAEMIEENEMVESSVNLEKLIAENTICVLEGLRDEDTKDETDFAGELGRSQPPLGSEVSDESEGVEVDEVVDNSSEVNEMAETNYEKKYLELVEANALLKKEVEDLNSALAEANKVKEELRNTNDEFETKLEETLALVQEKEKELADKAEAFEALEAEKAKLSDELDVASASLAEIAEERKLEVRKAALAELGLPEERIVKTLAKTADLSDEDFTSEVEDLKALIAELTPEPVAEKVEASEEEVEDKAEAAEEVSEEEIAEVLDEAEEEPAKAAAALAVASTDDAGEEEDTTEALRSIFAKAVGVNLSA